MPNDKQQTLAEIERVSRIFKRVTDEQFRIRCPICGDSDKDPRDTHCYIKCSRDPAEPILFNCFKCNAGGIVNSKFLKLVGVRPEFLYKYKDPVYNKIPSIKTANIELLTGTPIPNSPQIKYIEKRLGKGLTMDDYDRLKVIWDLSLIYPHISDVRVRNTMPSNRDTISFLSDDRSMIITRTFEESDADVSQWRKIRPFTSEYGSLYTIRASFNLFGDAPITVNIAEGIFDIISVFKNFNDGESSAYIAVLGSDYKRGVEHAVASGFIGSNVTVKIYIDWGIDMRKLMAQLRRYKWMFGKILIYRNALFKDVGRRIENIQLVETRV